MPELAKFALYRVDQCGYFQWGANAPAFGNLAQLLNDLGRWSRGKPLVETKTFESEGEVGFLPAYLLDVREHQGAWLVSLWNESPANSGQVASVRGNSNVGAADVVMNEIEAGNIPGFATHFWFLPANGVVVSVRFHQRMSGVQPMRFYMESFLESFASHVVTAADPGVGADILVAGYRAAAQQPLRTDVKARFKFSAARMPGDYGMLVEQAERVRRIIRKTTLELNRPAPRAMWQHLLEKVHLATPVNLPDHVRIKYDLDLENPLSGDQVQAIINDWLQSGDALQDWEDYGFVLTGDSKVYWLGTSVVRHEMELDVRRDNAEVVNAASLIGALADRRTEILRLLR